MTPSGTAYASPQQTAPQQQTAPPQQTPPADLAYTASAEGSLAAGNVRRVLVTLRGDVAWTGDTIGLAADPTFVYGEQSGAVRERDHRSRAFVYFHPRDRWFAFTMGGIETNRARRIDRRWQLGAGIGRRLVDEAAHTVRVTFAVLRERNRLRDDAPTDHWRTTLRLKGSHRRSLFRLQEELWWQPAFRGAPGQRWHAQASLDVRLVRGLSFRTSVEEHYEGRIAQQGTRPRPNDLRLTAGIAISSMTPP